MVIVNGGVDYSLIPSLHCHFFFNMQKKLAEETGNETRVDRVYAWWLYTQLLVSLCCSTLECDIINTFSGYDGIEMTSVIPLQRHRTE